MGNRVDFNLYAVDLLKDQTISTYFASNQSVVHVRTADESIDAAVQSLQKIKVIVSSRLGIYTIFLSTVIFSVITNLINNYQKLNLQFCYIPITTTFIIRLYLLYYTQLIHIYIPTQSTVADSFLFISICNK